MDLIKISNLLKDASDEALARTLSNPSSGVPSYMALSELTKRQNIREKYRSQTPTTSVYEDAQMKAAPQRSVGVPMAMRGPQPQQAPQGYAQGGEVQGYAYGGDVDYQDDLPWDERMRMWREMTGFGRMAPQPQVQPTFPGASAAQVRAADNRIAAANPDLTKFVPPKAPAADAGIRGVGQPQGKATTPAAPVDEWGNQLKDLTSQYKDAFQKQADMYQQQADELKGRKGQDAAMALMTAGLGMAAGKSQNAITNIAEGALPGMQQYIGAERARQDQLQKLAMGKGALGIEQLGAQLKGAGMGAEYGLGKEKMGIERGKLDVMRQQAANTASNDRMALLQARGNQQEEMMYRKLYAQGVADRSINPDKMPYDVWLSKVSPSAGTILPKGITVTQTSK